MPESMLLRDVDRCSILDDDAIQQLAAMYKVSRLAMRFRLINFGLLPPAIDPSAEGENFAVFWLTSQHSRPM